MKPEDSKHWVALVILAAATALTAALGALASVSAAEFYATLARPAWAPPPGVFGPVWTGLYVIMTVAAWLVVRTVGAAAARPALQLYALQLLANWLWSWLFFRFRLGGAAMLDVIVLLLLVAVCARSFHRRRALAGFLMLPYLAWVAFAAGLTWAVWRANPGLL